MNIPRFKPWAVWLLAALAALPSGAASISRREAVAVAEHWYAREIRASTTPLTPPERRNRLEARTQHKVWVVIGRDTLAEESTNRAPITAYVVTFEPSGYVVVSGEDTMQPVLAFNVTASFVWDSPEKSFLGHYLGRSMVSVAGQHRAANRLKMDSPPPPHTNWTRLRNDIASAPAASAPTSGDDAGSADPAPRDAGDIYVMWTTALWGQGDHYNDVVVAHNGGTQVPTGCTATAMAIQMRYFEWPPTGSGSHSYSDTWETVKHDHSVNFGAHTYNWTAMPTGVLTVDDTNVANLMYDCGVAVDMNYEPGGSGAWPSASAMNSYFRFRGTIENSSGTPSDHADALAYSIRSGLPTIICNANHTVVASGYRNTVAPYFYVNAGHDNAADSAWYNLDAMGWGDPSIDRSYPYSCPNNYVYVDNGAGAGENGNLQNPYNTVSEGQTAVPAGGHLWIKAGNYTGAGNVITLNKAMTVKSYLGNVTIGSP
jgi:hypothetical protein